MKYEAVIFDLFGTLVDNPPYEEYQNILRKVCSLIRVPFDDFTQLWSETAYERSLGTISTIQDNIEYICKKLGASTNNEDLELATRIRYDFIANVMIPRQDAVEVLSYLKSQGLKLGLISNCSTEPPIIWENLPCAALFDVALFSSSIGLRKPDSRIYMLALKQLEVKPEKCLYIGDGDSHELSGAESIGIHPVMIRVDYEDDTQPHLVNREDWQGTVISSLKDVLSLIK